MNEIDLTIQNPDLLLVADETGNSLYGCNQDWYRTKWQQMAGCGPSVASNLLLYHTRRECEGEAQATALAQCVNLMEAVWEHVTPTFRGVHTVELFQTGMESYARANGLHVTGRSLAIANKGLPRPTLRETVEFIRDGLKQDAPVAFLNLSRGKVKNLENWHWVTIAALRADEALSTVSVRIFDNAHPLDIDLRLWHQTTKTGGGFVYFVPETSSF